MKRWVEFKTPLSLIWYVFEEFGGRIQLIPPLGSNNPRFDGLAEWSKVTGFIFCEPSKMVNFSVVSKTLSKYKCVA